MENSNKIVPPHLNAEVYRTDTTGTNTISYLDYVRVHSDGSVLVGCSELTGRYWNGGASVFKSVQEAQKLYRNARKSISLTSGTPDGCFVESSSKILLCEDNGAVSLWTSSDDENAWKMWTEELSVAEHDDAALAIDCLVPGQEYVTVGADGHAKVWNINEMICVRNYESAHNMPIYALAVRPKSTTSFATGSADEYISLWDEHTFKPVMDVVKNDCGVRCVQWLDENKLVYGDEAGILRLVDVRNTENKQQLAEFPAPVHQLAIHSESQKIAICCDNKIVSVCGISEDVAKIIYHDRHMHSNYVRGLAWDTAERNSLHSLGWDGEIRTHKICS